MAVEIEYLGHSGFLIRCDGVTVAIDPFVSESPVADRGVSDIKCDHLLFTHGHFDHIGDGVAIAKNNLEATVYGTFEVMEYFGEHDVACQPINPGGKILTDFGYIAYVRADHSSSLAGKYMGVAAGIILHIGGKTIYHLGDTDLFSDMKLIGEIYKPDVALIPIGDTFTMGPELGARAAEFIGAPVVVPMHYKTWPQLRQSVEGFAPEGIEVCEIGVGGVMGV